MKRSKELLFIIIVILLIICVGIFNYNNDPYKLFTKNEIMNISIQPNELIYPTLYSFKERKFKKVLIGSSSFNTTIEFWTLDKKKISLLAPSSKNYEFTYDILKRYLELHPETEEAVLQIDYPTLINSVKVNQKDNSREHFKNTINLLFSINTTIKSYEIFKNKISNLLNKKSIENNLYVEVYPYCFDAIKMKEDKEEMITYNNKNIDRIISLLKEKNIKTKFIVLPINITQLVYLYKNKNLQEIILATKRHIVEKYNTTIYDMAFSNHLTNTSLFDENNISFKDYYHPTDIVWFERVYNVLFDIDRADKDLYFILDKNNFDHITRKQNKLIEDFLKTADEEFYKNFNILTHENNFRENYNKKFIRYPNQSNADIIKELEFRKRLVNEI